MTSAPRNRDEVVFFSHESRMFGAPRSLLAVVESESRRRPVRLAVAEHGPLVDAAESLGIPVDLLPRAFAGGAAPAGRTVYGSKLLRYLRGRRPGLVYVNTVAHASPVLAASMLGLRCLLHVRETEAYFSPRTAKGRWRLRRMLGYPDATLCVSRATQELALSRGADPRRTHVVYNGVDVASFVADPDRRRRARAELGFSDSDVVFGFVGQWSRRKGVDWILQAAERLGADRACRFLLVGGGNDLDADRRFRAQAEGLARPPVLVGFRDDVRPMLDAADAFLCPSRAEPFARVNLEAMAMGLPVIATRVGGNPEAILEGETGLLIAPDDPQALTDAIASLAKDSALRKRLGDAGRVRAVGRFSLERACAETASRIDAVLGRGR